MNSRLLKTPKLPSRLRGCARGAIGSVALALSSQFAPAQNAANADASYNAYLNAFLVRSGGRTFIANSLNNRNIADLWGQAYAITGIEDAYDRAPTPANRQLINDLLNTFIEVYGTQWTNGWNDDHAWGCIAMIRGYQITGNPTFLSVAVQNWNDTYNRGWDSALGGGIWETTDKWTKAALSNNPMVIAGCSIYLATGDAAYLTKCRAIFKWAKDNLVYANGQVNEARTRTGELQVSDNVYNNGAYVNAANAMYRITGEIGYFNDAKNTADHVVNSQSVLSRDQGNAWADQFVRGLSVFARENNLWGTYSGWLNNNAATSWNNRRTDRNLTNNVWTSPTPGGEAWCLECLSAMVAQQVSQINPLSGTHFIVSQQSGKALENGNSTANNAGIIQWDVNRNPQQWWTFIQNSDTSWNIVNARSSKALDNAGASTNGPQAIQWTADSANNNQRWWVDRNADGTYRIWSKGNSKSLDNSSNTTNGYPIIQWDGNSGSQQRWNIR